MADKKEEEIDFQGDEQAKELWGDPSTEPKSFWWKAEKVGDVISGELVMAPYDQDSKFGPQKVYVIRKSNGEEWNVALKHTSNKRQIQALNGAMIGDILGFRFSGTYETDYGNPGKNIEVRLRPMNK